PHLPICRQLPDSHGPGAFSDEQAIPFRTEHHAGQMRFTLPKRFEQSPGADIPDVDVLVLSHRGKPLSIRAEGDAAYGLLVAKKGVKEQLAGRAVPEADGFIFAARGNPSIPAERDRLYAAGVSGERSSRFSRRQGPDLYRFIRTSRDEEIPARTER